MQRRMEDFVKSELVVTNDLNDPKSGDPFDKRSEGYLASRGKDQRHTHDIYGGAFQKILPVKTA